jgi:copper(I)-binding protein
MRIALLAAVAASLLSLNPAAAHSVKVGQLELTDLWTRATPPRAPAAGGFLTITNFGDEPDRLIAVASPAAEIGEVHEMKVEDGIMTMRPLDAGLEIPAHGTVTLAPGGFHIMLIDLKTPLVEGEETPVTLEFEKAGTIDTFLHVEGFGAKGPGGMARGEGQAQ